MDKSCGTTSLLQGVVNLDLNSDYPNICKSGRVFCFWCLGSVTSGHGVKEIGHITFTLLDSCKSGEGQGSEIKDTFDII